LGLELAGLEELGSGQFDLDEDLRAGNAVSNPRVSIAAISRRRRISSTEPSPVK
jgi:hypothetical protein